MKPTAACFLFRSPRSRLGLALCLTLGITACASSYTSYYKETNRSLQPRPVRPEAVKIVRSREDLSRSWTEIGLFRGKAPTVDEAMDAAKRECGRHGADLYILNTDPFFEDGGYRVHGVCGVSS